MILKHLCRRDFSHVFPRTRGGNPTSRGASPRRERLSSHARGITLLQFAKAEHRMPIKKNTTVWENPKRTVRRQLSLAVVNSSIPEKTKTVNGMDRERDEVFPAHAEASLPKPYEDVPAASLPRAQEDKFPHTRRRRARLSAQTSRARPFAQKQRRRAFRIIPDFTVKRKTGASRTSLAPGGCGTRIRT